MRKGKERERKERRLESQAAKGGEKTDRRKGSKCSGQAGGQLLLRTAVPGTGRAQPSRCDSLAASPHDNLAGRAWLCSAAWVPSLILPWD